MVFSRSKSHSWIITAYDFLWSFPVLSIFHVFINFDSHNNFARSTGLWFPFTGEEKDKETSMEFNEFISLTFAEYLLRPGTAVCTKKSTGQSPLLTKFTHICGGRGMGREWCLSEPRMPPYSPSANLSAELLPEGFHHLALIVSHLTRAPTHLCFLSPGIFWPRSISDASKELPSVDANFNQ